MNIKDELIKYAKWYDRATAPEDAQTDEADLVQNVESYLQTEGKHIALSAVSGRSEQLICPRCASIDINTPIIELECNCCDNIWQINCIQ